MTEGRQQQLRQLVALIATAVVPHVQHMSPQGVALVAWSVRAAGLHMSAAHAPLLTACAVHAAQHLAAYKGRELTALLSAGYGDSVERDDDPFAWDTPLTDAAAIAVAASAVHPHSMQRLDTAAAAAAVVHAADSTADIDSSSHQQLHDDLQAAWDTLWASVLHSSHTLLPRMGHAELAHLSCMALHHFGRYSGESISVDGGGGGCSEEDYSGDGGSRQLVGDTGLAQLMSGVLQLVLGAVAQRARALRQQELAQTGASVFATAAQHPLTPTPHHRHSQRRQQLQQLNNADSNPAVEELSAAADSSGLPTSSSAGSDPQPQQSQSPQRSRPRRQPTLSLRASDKLHLPTPHTLAYLVWSMSRAGLWSAHLFELAAAVCSQQNPSHRLPPTSAVRLLWAAARGRTYHPELVARLCSKLAEHACSLSGAQAASALAAMASVAHYDFTAAAALTYSLTVRDRGAAMRDLQPDQQAVAMWAVAKLRLPVHPSIAK